MNTLLKDLPEHKERIENNYLLSKQIQDVLETEVSIALTESLINMESEDVPTPRSKGDNLTYCAEIDNRRHLAERVLATITDFVNENYEWKGIKA